MINGVHLEIHNPTLYLYSVDICIKIIIVIILLYTLSILYTCFKC